MFSSGSDLLLPLLASSDFMLLVISSKCFNLSFIRTKSMGCPSTFRSVFAEGVGKSSLISTFVSRHFSEVVPGIMTRVRLPPDPESACITTIVDSQGGDAALMSAATTISLSSGSTIAGGSASTLQHGLSNSASSNVGIDNVDSIILIYDLDRVETFFRLENHWLPLIERCYNGEVSLSIDFAPLSLIVDSFA